MSIRTLVAAHALLVASTSFVAFDALACAAPPLGARSSLPPPRDLTALVARVRGTSRLPALGAAIVTSSGLEAVGVDGVRSVREALPVTLDDAWHIGSCTKALTATLAARLVDRGRVRWDTTIGSVLGEGAHPAWRDVTLEWLLCHRSGAPLNFDESAWERMVARGGTPREQRRSFVVEGLSAAPPNPPNTRTLYSNSGYLVAGVMLEELCNAAWEDLMRAEVFAPLGMHASGFGAPGTEGRLDQPLGHVRGENGWSPIELGPNADNPAATGPAGTIHTTLGDWARFVAAHLSRAPSYLGAESWARLHASGGDDWETTPGWMQGSAEWAGGPILRHLGSNGFWLAEATLAPERDVAFLLVTNACDDSVEAPFRELFEALVAEHGARRESAR